MRTRPGKHYAPGAWLQYLLSHFLRPGSLARDDPSGLFDEFTFDHELVGVMAACRDDTDHLWLIRPEGDLVHEETIRPGRMPEW